MNKIDWQNRNNIDNRLPELVQLTAIKAVKKSFAMSEEQEIEFWTFVNNTSLAKAFNDLASLRPRKEISEYTSIESFVERFFDLSIAKISGVRSERTPRQVDDVRKNIKTKLKSLLTELQFAEIDFDIHELLDMAIENTTKNEQRKFQLSLFKTEVSAIPHFKTLLTPPKLSELLSGVKNKLDDCSNRVLLGKYDQVSGVRYHFYGTTNIDIAHERELLFLFDCFCGNIPDCFWVFHGEIFQHGRDKDTAIRGFRRLKEKWRKASM